VETREKDVGRTDARGEERERACNFFSVRVLFVRKMEFHGLGSGVRRAGPRSANCIRLILARCFRRLRRKLSTAGALYPREYNLCIDGNPP